MRRSDAEERNSREIDTTLQKTHRFDAKVQPHNVPRAHREPLNLGVQLLRDLYIDVLLGNGRTGLGLPLCCAFPDGLDNAVPATAAFATRVQVGCTAL